MGKVKGIFGSNISGRVGNVVFRKGAKANIVSQRPAAVKNPRSDLQQIQRAYIKTVASAYSVFKAICDHSFEGVTYGGQSMHYFNKINYPVVVGAEKAVLKNSDSVVVPVPFIVSKGSINWNSAFDDNGQIANLSDYMKVNKIADILDVQYGQLLQALGLKDGDQITIISVYKENRKFLLPNGLLSQYANNISYARYILKSTALTTKAFVKVAQESELYELNPAIVAADSQMNNLASIVVDANGKIYIDVDPDILSLYTAIISRRDSDKWLRSNASIYVANESESQVYKISDVLPSYKPSEEPYLNNAEK